VKPYTKLDLARTSITYGKVMLRSATSISLFKLMRRN